MNSIDSSDVFLDSNMIIYISKFKKYDVVEWLNNLYNKIYIHIQVLDELLLSEHKNFCNKQIELKTWILFDPEDDTILNEDQFEIYTSLYSEVREDFTNYQLTRLKKQTTDRADIGILAGCRTLSIAIISTQDGDFREVITANNYVVNTEEDKSDSDTLIQVHDLEKLGLLCVTKEVATLSQVKKFISAVVPTSKIKILNSLYSKLNQL